MRVLQMNSLKGTDRDVSFNGGNSLRGILEKDGMGFSLHKTVIPKGGPYHWHYTKHLEACFCVEGHGELTNLENGQKFRVHYDTLYILDSHDDHTFEAFDDTILISVFNPPVKGSETHKKDGSYEL